MARSIAGDISAALLFLGIGIVLFLAVGREVVQSRSEGPPQWWRPLRAGMSSAGVVIGFLLALTLAARVFIVLR